LSEIAPNLNFFAFPNFVGAALPKVVPYHAFLVARRPVKFRIGAHMQNLKPNVQPPIFRTCIA